MGTDFRLGTVYFGVGIGCFALLGGLTGRHVKQEVVPILLFALGLAILALSGLAFIGLMLGLFSPGVRRQHGREGLTYAVGKGYLMIIPFTLLALMAELYLGWSAVQPFTTAGMMASGAAVGVESVKLGGGKIRSVAVPMGSAFVLSFLWMFLSAMAMGMLVG